MGYWEDREIHISSAYVPPHGTQIVQASTIRLLEPEELLAYDIVYQTVVDCYKVATKQWRHFKCMRWHEQNDFERILVTARRKVEEWLESDTLTQWIVVLGWEPEPSIRGMRDVLDGNRNGEVADLLKQISKERDARRNRETNFNV